MKMWNCRFDGRYLASVHNVPTGALRRDAPDVEAIRKALPRRYQRMQLGLWLTHNDTPSEGVMYATVWIIRENGMRTKHSVNCEAYDFNPSV